MLLKILTVVKSNDRIVVTYEYGYVEESALLFCKVEPELLIFYNNY